MDQGEAEDVGGAQHGVGVAVGSASPAIPRNYKGLMRYDQIREVHAWLHTEDRIAISLCLRQPSTIRVAMCPTTS